MQARLKLLLIAALGLFAVDPAWAVGRFMYVDGNVTVRNATGVVRPVRAGDQINEQETVLVGDGRAQLRFDDGGWIALQPRTVFEVKEHSPREEGNTVFALIKGGARAVTGLLADRRPARYRVETPMATVGIRGTSFTAVVCVASCNTPDGLYVTGGDGTAFVRNGFGEVDVTRGRTAYVASAQTPPQESTVKPTAEVQQTVTQQTVAAASTTNPGELLPGNFIYIGGSWFTGPLENINVTSFGTAGAIGGHVSGRASGVVRGIVRDESVITGTDAGSFGTAITSLHAGDTATVVVDALKRPVSITLAGADGGRVSATAMTAPTVAENDGVLFWGRWTNATFNFDLNDPSTPVTANGSATVNGYLHYIVGAPAASIPTSGTATYSLIGGSGSTSLSGTVGRGIIDGTLTANFLGNSVTISGVKIDHGGIWAVSGGTARFDSVNRASFSTANASGVPGTAFAPTGGSYLFKFDGFFAGGNAPTAPARAGTGWIIQRTGDPIFGASGFKCATGC